MRRPDLVSLKAFAAVAERGSFSRAAADLGVSPSALSQSLRKLETQFGVRLLDRTTRSVSLTEAGTMLLGRLSPLLVELDVVVDELMESRQAMAGMVRASVPKVAVATFIAPVLGDFHRAHPQIELEISVDDRLADIVADRFDVGIRLGERLQKDMVATRLGGDARCTVVASPAYLARRGAPSHPTDLVNHSCVQFRWPGSGALYRWEFEEDGRPFEVAVSGPLTVDDVGLMLAAAADGIGLAYMLEEQARPRLEDGSVVRVLNKYCPPFPGFYLYHASRRHMRGAVRAFIDAVVQRARSAGDAR